MTAAVLNTDCLCRSTRPQDDGGVYCRGRSQHALQAVVIERGVIERGSIQQLALQIALRKEREIDVTRIAQCKVVEEPFHNPADVPI
jgi:hypothetical protein